MGLILDTNFVIGLEREAKRRLPGTGPAEAFLTAHARETFFITFTVAGELACGQSTAALADWKRLCRPFAILPWSLDVSWHYGEIYRQLAATGKIIGTNDIWIAATALVYNLPIVTNNVGEFNRISGLNVVRF